MPTWRGRPKVSLALIPVVIRTMQPAPPARTDGAKPQPKIDGQPSPLSAAAVTDDSITRAIAEDERRSPEVALGLIGRALSRGPSPTRESASSRPESISRFHAPSTRRPLDGVAVGVSHLSKYPDWLVDLHRSTKGACCTGLVPYLPPIPWGAPQARVGDYGTPPEPPPVPAAAAAPPAEARGSKRARNSE